MKKGQIEIVGLTVIVIILAIGLVIALMFILRPKTDLLEDQRQNIRATALLNALIETNNYLMLLPKKLGQGKPAEGSRETKEVRWLKFPWKDSLSRLSPQHGPAIP